jgi:GxxExxY protein
MSVCILKHPEITEKIILGYYEVYNELGSGFLESVYENALDIVLNGYGLHVDRQKDISVKFRGAVVGEFRPDLFLDGKVIVEIKAVERLLPVHEAQLINYLKATEIEVGVLLNFGKRPEFKRLAYDNRRKCFVREQSGEYITGKNPRKSACIRGEKNNNPRKSACIRGEKKKQ